MTEAEITALVERIVEVKLRERDRKRARASRAPSAMQRRAELRKLARGD